MAERKRSGSHRSRRKQPAVSIDQSYSQWKSLVPILYDWFVNHRLVWPSLSCRWGPLVNQSMYKQRQRLYLSEQTDGIFPNTLIIAHVEVVKPRVATPEHIADGFKENERSPFVRKYKTIIHPGEVNSIRELPQNSNIIATHTDSPDVLIWDVDRQPKCKPDHGAPESRADLILTGHEDNAEFALAMGSIEPFVLSGGKDKTVVLWNINDHISTLATEPGSIRPAGPKGSNIKTTSTTKDHESTNVGPRGIYKGHSDTVEDVQFCPTSAHQFCSVGDDSCLILWDARTGTSPTSKVEKAHEADLHCVDWNPHDENFIITGSADSSVHLFDRRNLTKDGVGLPLHKFQGHDAPVLSVQWSPHNKSYFGSAAEDGFLNIWDFEKAGETNATEEEAHPPGLFLKHCGHRDKIVDFHWNVIDPWTLVSVSNNFLGGGTLQIWRVTDLLYRPREEVLAEFLDKPTESG